MRTLFMDYPDSGRRYKIRFNVAGCDPKSVRVSTDGERIVVRATRYDDEFPDGREYSRKIQKPKDVDHSKFKAYLTSDSILVVEAPVPPSTLNLRKVIASPCHSHAGSTHSRSPSGSPAAGGPDTPSKEKIGVPIFREESGQRRLHLVVDLGAAFRPQDITVQVIKENRIQIRAKREEKTSERLCKSKFSKEYELGEKIETFSLTGGLSPASSGRRGKGRSEDGVTGGLSGDGRLYVGAYAKGQGSSNGMTTSKSGAIDLSASSGMLASDSEPHNGGGSLQPCNVNMTSSTSGGSQTLS